MANLRMTLLDLLNKSEQGADPNFLRDGVRLLAQELMDAEVSDLVGAEPHERTAGRTTYRNGYRDREWDTRVGTLELQIPSSARGPTSRACSSLAADMSARCFRWFRRPTSTACRPEPSTTSPRRSGSRASPRTTSAAG